MCFDQHFVWWFEYRLYFTLCILIECPHSEQNWLRRQWANIERLHTSAKCCTIKNHDWEIHDQRWSGLILFNNMSHEKGTIEGQLRCKIYEQQTVLRELSCQSSLVHQDCPRPFRAACFHIGPTDMDNEKFRNKMSVQQLLAHLSLQTISQTSIGVQVKSWRIIAILTCLRDIQSATSIFTILTLVCSPSLSLSVHLYKCWSIVKWLAKLNIK